VAAAVNNSCHASASGDSNLLWGQLFWNANRLLRRVLKSTGGNCNSPQGEIISFKLHNSQQANGITSTVTSSTAVANKQSGDKERKTLKYDHKTA